ncbi:enoyl-CoA hydratase-related protein [Bordetella genomosp. 10]|uniref:enoyl-CoA hydratase-related protein n=1 Tax=Bordetella genomosp. 10 TaxID=1416804 RepID=UPI00211ADECA|nr:enoyl-CoA hydratase-related protein [Bordetella genomosp. 10]
MKHSETRTSAAPSVAETGDAAASQELLQRQEGRLLVLTLNRPARRNALSPGLYAALLRALGAAAADDDVGAVVLTGAGGAFCAGGDVSRMAASAGGGDQGSSAGAPALSFEQKMAALRRRTGICELLHTMPKPTIAMLRGPAVGAGLSLALACDLRYADTTARLRTGFVDVGLPGDFGGHYFLPRLVGMAKARELYFTSPMLDASAALALGLVNAVSEPDALESTVMGVARRLADGPRVAIAHMKANLNDAAGLSLPEMLDRECWRHVRCTQTADHREAAAAFVEKRAPVFGQPDPA